MVKWFADRADMIIIMFDAHKLDISDELKVIFESKRSMIGVECLMTHIFGRRACWTN